MNEQNLINLRTRSQEERQAIARMGGLKSGHAKHERAETQKAIAYIMHAEIFLDSVFKYCEEEIKKPLTEAEQTRIAKDFMKFLKQENKEALKPLLEAMALKDLYCMDEKEFLKQVSKKRKRR